MEKFLLFLKNVAFLFITTLIFLFIFEFLSRTVIGLISKNKDVFFYFINKKVDIQIFDLSDLKINIISNRNIKNLL